MLLRKCCMREREDRKKSHNERRRAYLRDFAKFRLGKKKKISTNEITNSIPRGGRERDLALRQRRREVSREGEGGYGKKKKPPQKSASKGRGSLGWAKKHR